MSIPSSPEVEKAVRDLAVRAQGSYNFVKLAEDVRAAQHAASTQPLLAEIERLKGENEDLSNERDRAVEGLLRFVAHPDAEDGADGALCALVARAEAEAQKLRELVRRFVTEGRVVPSHPHLAAYVAFPDELWVEARKALGGS